MEAFGINIVSIVAYLLIFLVIYLLTKRFINRVLETYDLREKTIKDGLHNAERASELKLEALKEANEEKEKKIQEAYKHADEIIEAAQTQESRIVEEATNKAKQILSDAQVEINLLKKQAQQDGLSNAKDIIKAAINKAFDNYELSSADEEKLIENSLRNLNIK